MTLQDLGIDEALERTYREVLRSGPTTVAELAAGLNRDPESLAADVAALLEFRLLRRVDDDRVEALPAAAALGSLVERREDEVIVRFRRIAALRSALPELADLQTDRRPRTVEHTELERIEDVGALRERIEELAFFSRHSLYSVQPGGPASRESLEASRPLDLRGLRREIDMRIIHEARVLEDEYNELYLRDIVARGAQVRFNKHSLDRVLIMDRSIAVVPIDPDNSGRGALVVRHPGLVNGFVDLFERAWADATPFTLDETNELVISDEDRRILVLLGAGCTDETASRELSVSVRHLRRQVSRLMLALGATSRFAAGAAAARRGWI